VRKSGLADVTDVMSICTQYDWRPHVLHTYRTLQLIHEALFHAGQLRFHVGCNPPHSAKGQFFRLLKIQRNISFGIFRAMTVTTAPLVRQACSKCKQIKFRTDILLIGGLQLVTSNVNIQNEQVTHQFLPPCNRSNVFHFGLYLHLQPYIVDILKEKSQNFVMYNYRPNILV